MIDLQTLVLNADYRPLSYNPLSLWSWKDAFTALFLDRVTLVANYDVEAHSPSRSLKVPSVVALKSYVALARSPAFTRYNSYLRDTFTCQYCGLRLPSGGLTFDHVVPRSRGGLSTWENVVAACKTCAASYLLPRRCRRCHRASGSSPPCWPGSCPPWVCGAACAACSTR